MEVFKMFINFEKDNLTIYFVKNANTGKKEIIFIKDDRFYGNLKNFTANWGNYWFLYAKQAACRGEYGENVMDNMFLDSCALNEDFDSYSDIFKDIHKACRHYCSSFYYFNIRLLLE